MTTKKLLKIKDVCTMLSYDRRKVYALIRDRKLRTVETGAGQRVIAESIDQWLEQEAACPGANRKPAAAKAKVRTATTQRTPATFGASRTMGDDTKLPIVIPSGRKLDLRS